MRGPLRRILDRRPLRRHLSPDTDKEPLVSEKEQEPSLYSNKAKEENGDEELQGSIKRRLRTTSRRSRLRRDRREEEEEPVFSNSPGAKVVDFHNKAKERAANFPNDHDYTIETMHEELSLMERHLRDGSWKLCNCNPEKHLPLLAGLASEGIGFTDDPDEKLFMEKVRDTARIWKLRIKSDNFTDADANKLRGWAREQRHRIEYKVWHGKIPENPECAITPQDYLRRMK